MKLSPLCPFFCFWRKKRDDYWPEGGLSAVSQSSGDRISIQLMKDVCAFSSRIADGARSSPRNSGQQKFCLAGKSSAMTVRGWKLHSSVVLRASLSGFCGILQLKPFFFFFRLHTLYFCIKQCLSVPPTHFPNASFPLRFTRSLKNDISNSWLWLLGLGASLTACKVLTS